MADGEIQFDVDFDVKALLEGMQRAKIETTNLLNIAKELTSQREKQAKQSEQYVQLLQKENTILQKQAEIADSIEKLRKAHKSTADAKANQQQAGAELSALRETIKQADRVVGNLSKTQAYKDLESAPAPRSGGTYADARNANKVLGLQILDINSTTEQLEARIGQEAAKATERLIKSTASVISARLNKAAFDADSLIKGFGEPSSLKAKTNKRNILAELENEKYGDVADLAQFRAREEAIKLEKQQRAAALKLEAEKSERGRYLAEGMASSYSMTTRMASASSPLQPTKQGSDRPAPGSPEAIAAGFENRIRIFSDYATIGTAVIGIKSLLQSVTELDDGLKQFQAITRTTDSELAKFKDTLLDIGSSSRFSLKDLTELATVLGQTGLAAADVAKTIPSVIDLATASGSTIKQTTDVFTTAFGAFQMQAAQAPDVANTIAEALNQTKLSVEQLSQGLSYSANIAAESGVSFNELTAVLAGLSQAGIKSGSTAGTGVRQLLQELNAPTEKLVNVMNQLGITSQDVSVKANGFIGVLENLKEKGFGTSEALRSLDLRAASAFTALTSRTDRIKAYQESMALSNAATEGAAKASESLNATWTRVGNTAQALASKALAPMIEALTKLGAILADVGKAAEGMGGLLPLLGGAGSAVAGGVAASWAVQMARGVAQLALNFKEAETAAAGFGAVVNGVMRSNPVFFAAFLGLSAGMAAASYFGGKSELVKRIEEGKEALNGLQSRQAQTEASIASIDKSIGNLIDKREKLNSDGIARRDAILQAQTDFRQLGLDIDINSTNIDVLIKALQSLRGELQGGLPTNFALQLSKTTQAIKDNLQAANENDAGSSLRVLQENGVYGYRMSSRSATDQRLNTFVQSRFQNRLDPALRFLQSDTSSLNYNDSAKEGNKILGALNREQAAVSNRIDAGDKNPELVKDLKLIASLIKESTQKLGQLNNIQGMEVQRKQLGRDVSVSEIQTTSAYSDLKTSLEGITQAFKKDLGVVLDDPLIKTDYPARQKRLKELYSNSQGVASGYEQQLNDAQAELAKKYGMEIVKIAFQPLMDQIQNIKSGTTGPQIDIQKFAVSDTTRSNQTSIREIEAQKKVVNASIKAANSTEEVEALYKKLKLLTQQEFEIRDEDIRLKSRLINQSTETINEELEKSKQILADSNEKLDLDMQAKNKEIIMKMVDSRLASLKEEEDLLKARYKNFLAQLNLAEKSDVEKIGGLEGSLREISSALTKNAEQQAINVATKERLQISGFDFGSVESKIANAAIERGGGQFTRYLLGLANAESSMNPSARNGSATGLFQFMPDTWKNTGGGDIYDVATQVRNVLKLMQDDFVAFRNKFNRTPDDNELYLMHQQGQRAAMALLDPENASLKASDVIENAGGNRKAIFNSGNKNVDILAKDFVSLVKNYFDKNAKTDVIGDKNIRLKQYAAVNAAKEDESTRNLSIAAREGYVYPGMTNGFGSSMMAGSAAFFKSSGMLNAEKEFKSFNEIIADSWGQTMGSMNSSMSQFFLNFANGTMTGKDAFLGFAQSIIASMMQIASNVAASQVLKALFGGQMVNSAGGGEAYLTGGLFGSALRYITGAATPTIGGAGALAVPTFSTGGFIRYADGGATANRDSVPALLMPGEYVLRKSAVDVIGRDRLDQVNAMGATRLSQSDQKAPPAASGTAAQPTVTNVWVVSPDQVPPPSERDIIVTVARDIQNRGSIRQLIQSVATGAA